MMEKSETLTTTKKRHNWNSRNECIICGVKRIKSKHPNNEKWTYYEYVDTETGEIKRSIICFTKQLKMKL
jgi:hypothetical protein